jgi:hypothetical protein
VEHTQMHLAPKFSIILAIHEEFLVISLFHETKIPTMYMKVQVYSKFSKNKIRKQMKSPSSMRIGRFHPPKCRGKLQKMGVMYIYSRKMPGPSSQHKRKSEENAKIAKKGGPVHNLLDCGPRLVGGR